MASLTLSIPDIGDYHDVPVIEILVKAGDTVEKDAPLLVLESDKATLEVPAPAAGVVRALNIKLGDKVSKGTVFGELETADASAPAPTAPATASKASPPAPAAASAPPAAAAPAASEPAATGRIVVTIPDIGDYHDVPVIELLVKDGDAITKDAPLLVLESDKATLEVPAPASGVVSGLKLKLGDKVSKGAVVCELRVAQPEIGNRESGIVEAEKPAAAAPEPSAPVASAPKPAPAVKADDSRFPEGSRPLPGRSEAPLALPMAHAPPTPDSRNEVPYAGPATRKFARELGVDLSTVTGSGRRGRILIEDVQGFVKQRMAAPTIPDSRFPIPGGQGIPAIPAVDFSQFGSVETKPLARIRKLSAAHLQRSWLNLPHVTQTDEVDITELEAFRKAQTDEVVAGGGPKLTLLPFVIKAVAAALKAYPEFNSSLAPDGESLILKHYAHIGFAADTPNGLVVPVVRDADRKGIVELARETAELAKKAREGKLKPDEMRGGCFSISSLGGIGGSFFTPIVNAPEVGILGVSKSQIKPVWDGHAFKPRLLCPLSLSYDHRVIDGAYAARFIVHLGKLLGDLRRLTL